MAELIPSEELSKKLQELPSWQLSPQQTLHRSFVFKDFVTAFGFMTEVAIRAEVMNHHPQWSNVYKKVEVDLTTHEAGGITDLDFQLAKIMDKVAESKLSL